jgi:hypothetical protein
MPDIQICIPATERCMGLLAAVLWEMAITMYALIGLWFYRILRSSQDRRESEDARLSRKDPEVERFPRWMVVSGSVLCPLMVCSCVGEMARRSRVDWAAFRASRGI